MNAPLHKAIEHNAVRPFYVDKISSSYTRRIEALDTVEAVQAASGMCSTSHCSGCSRLKKTQRPKKQVEFIEFNLFGGASGDTELFEKHSNINGFWLSDNKISCL